MEKLKGIDELIKKIQQKHDSIDVIVDMGIKIGLSQAIDMIKEYCEITADKED